MCVVGVVGVVVDVCVVVVVRVVVDLRVVSLRFGFSGLGEIVSSVVSVSSVAFRRKTRRSLSVPSSIAFHSNKYVVPLMAICGRQASGLPAGSVTPLVTLCGRQASGLPAGPPLSTLGERFTSVIEIGSVSPRVTFCGRRASGPPARSPLPTQG